MSKDPFIEPDLGPRPAGAREAMGVGLLRQGAKELATLTQPPASRETRITLGPRGDALHRALIELEPLAQRRA